MATKKAPKAKAVPVDNLPNKVIEVSIVAGKLVKKVVGEYSDTPEGMFTAQNEARKMDVASPDKLYYYRMRPY